MVIDSNYSINPILGEIFCLSCLYH